MREKSGTSMEDCHSHRWRSPKASTLERMKLCLRGLKMYSVWHPEFHGFDKALVTVGSKKKEKEEEEEREREREREVVTVSWLLNTFQICFTTYI